MYHVIYGLKWVLTLLKCPNLNLCKPFRNDHACLVNSHEIICRETRPKETAYIMYSSTSEIHVIELEFSNERKNFSKVEFNFEDVDFSLLTIFSSF